MGCGTIICDGLLECLALVNIREEGILSNVSRSLAKCFCVSKVALLGCLVEDGQAEHLLPVEEEGEAECQHLGEAAVEEEEEAAL